MKFILVVLLILPGGRDFVQFQEFETQTTCEQAKMVLMNETEDISAYCLKK